MASASLASPMAGANIQAVQFVDIEEALVAQVHQHPARDYQHAVCHLALASLAGKRGPAAPRRRNARQGRGKWG